jgi:hypothetical protein
MTLERGGGRAVPRTELEVLSNLVGSNRCRILAYGRVNPECVAGQTKAQAREYRAWAKRAPITVICDAGKRHLTRCVDLDEAELRSGLGYAGID